MPSFTVSSTGSAWLASTSTTRHRRIGGSTGLLQMLVVTLLFSVFFDGVQAAIDRVYCSSENTAADTRPNNYIYQSEGNCHKVCIGKTAYGILMGKNCWCSNYAPLESVDLSECTDPCPGFPDDRCGTFRKGLYNYIQLPDVAPSSRTDLPSTTSSDPTDGPGTTPDPTPIVSVTTILGTQRTVTITPSGGPTGSSVPMNSGESFTDNAGRVAGLVVGLILGLFLIIALIVFFIRKRRNDRRKSMSSTHSHPEMGMSGNASPINGGSASPSNRPRSTSTLGLVGPFEKATSGAAVTEQERMTDQRLDPGQIWMRFDNDNSSRVSLRSLQDNHDYSRRVLKLTNPDG